MHSSTVSIGKQIDQIDTICRKIFDLLADRSEGVREFELLQQLEESAPLSQGMWEPSEHIELETFRRHFALFHCLYKLRRRLRDEGRADLEIFCMNIRILPRENKASEELPKIGEARHTAPWDGLEAYYMDWTNFAAADETSVGEMLDEGARIIGEQLGRRSGGAPGASTSAHRAEQLAQLGLEDPVSDKEILRRYRQLSLIHHPDQGGDPQIFGEIQSAVEGLRS